MKKTIGQTLKELRINLNLTQNQVCSEDLSRSALSKIESDNMNPSYQVILLVSQRLGIPYNEIVYIQNNFQLTQKERIIYDFKRLRNSTYQDAFTKLNQDISAFLKIQNDRDIKELQAVLQAISAFQQSQNFSVPTETVQFIWTRLEKQDDWQELDIYILSHIFFIFEVDTAKNIVKQLLTQIEKYRYFGLGDGLKVSVLLNMATFLKLNGRLIEADVYVSDALELAIIQHEPLMKLAAMYRQSEIMFIKGYKEKAQRQAQHVFSALILLEETNLYRNWNEEWLKIVNSDLIAKAY